MLDDNLLLDAVYKTTPQWLAGFFDGEGYVSGLKNGTAYSVKVGLVQKDERLLQVIRFKFPFSGSCTTKDQRSSCYDLNYSGKNVIPFMEYIRDYVIIKKPQLELGLELAKLCGTDGTRLSKDVICKREELASKISEINKKNRG